MTNGNRPVGSKWVPSVGETVENWAWLSSVLRRELQQEVDGSADGQEGQQQALRDADIE